MSIEPILFETLLSFFVRQGKNFLIEVKFVALYYQHLIFFTCPLRQQE